MGKGIIFVLSGPSAVGKTTAARALVASDPWLSLTTSCTTRPQSEAEVPEYNYMTNHEFEKGIDSSRFFEYTEYCGYRYGTSHLELKLSQVTGKDTVMVLDVAGAVRLMQRSLDYPLVTIFLMPDNLTTLEHRILRRDRDSDSDIGRRLILANEELHAVELFDHQVLVELDQPVEEVVEVLGGIVSRSREQRFSSYVQGAV